MTERKDIGVRLENWARWASDAGAHGRGAACMTGAICESLRRNALGDVWSGHVIRREIDVPDALKIMRAITQISYQMRLLIQWTYVEGARPEVICRRMAIPVRPASEFVERFRAAQEAIEDIVESGNK